MCGLPCFAAFMFQTFCMSTSYRIAQVYQAVNVSRYMFHQLKYNHDLWWLLHSIKY